MQQVAVHLQLIKTSGRDISCSNYNDLRLWDVT